APSMRAEIDEAAAAARELVAEWGPEVDDSQPKRLARAIEGRIPVVYGGRTTTAAARRWRSQLNENAKLPAFFGDLPEAHHNEVVGWHHADEVLLGIVLEGPDEHERMARRFDVTAEVMSAAGFEALRVESQGQSPTARLMSLVLLGDLVSVYLAVLRGIDPTPVEEIEALKARLG
ncbi:MAG TPA: SIS domain-containing protein, partial [Thermoleophilaceae bacterium]|nr:SIS domain-containing protein [Thermoleophilaceae bacterium]